jgi:hypothetical protein
MERARRPVRFGLSGSPCDALAIIDSAVVGNTAGLGLVPAPIPLPGDRRASATAQYHEAGEQSGERGRDQNRIKLFHRSPFAC